MGEGTEALKILGVIVGGIGLIIGSCSGLNYLDKSKWLPTEVAENIARDTPNIRSMEDDVKEIAKQYSLNIDKIKITGASYEAEPGVVNEYEAVREKDLESATRWTLSRYFMLKKNGADFPLSDLAPIINALGEASNQDNVGKEFVTACNSIIDYSSAYPPEELTSYIRTLDSVYNNDHDSSKDFADAVIYTIDECGRRLGCSLKRFGNNIEEIVGLSDGKLADSNGNLVGIPSVTDFKEHSKSIFEDFEMKIVEPTPENQYEPIALEQFVDKADGSNVEISAYPVSQDFTQSDRLYVLGLQDYNLILLCASKDYKQLDRIMRLAIYSVILSNKETYDPMKITAYGKKDGSLLWLDAVEVNGVRIEVDENKEDFK
ncbi:MAG: hypothetical protein ABIB71_07270 [Candidatus Woesearchaeota archaeon]